MRKLIFSLLLCIVLLCVSGTALAKADTIGVVDYERPSVLLERYISKCETTEAKVDRILGLIKIVYPTWRISYEVGVFDCSEMAAFVQYFLGKSGIDSKYCFSREMHHTWVEVPIETYPYKLTVEAVYLVIVPNNNVRVNYNREDTLYDGDAYEALDENEYDWYNSPIFN